MNAIVPVSAYAIDDICDFFAPVDSNKLEELFIRRDLTKRDIETITETVTAMKTVAVSVFINANLERDSHISFARLFDSARAVKQLDRDMWHQALNLTDVWEYMPQARKDQWNRQLSAWKEDSSYKEGKNPELDMQPFERDTVIATMKQLLLMRSQFFTEKIDGLFRGLSGDHVTNSPAAFGKRMIIANALHGDSPNYHKYGLIDDLRMVINKFRGLPEKLGLSSYDILRRCYQTRTGEWFEIDGGALRIRVYLVGTAHLEVNEEIAWKLNKVLASLYPMAIPAKFRERPKKSKTKEFTLFDDMIPLPVRNLLGGMKRTSAGGCCLYFDGTFNYDKAAISEAESILAAIGGVKVEKSYQPGRWEKPRTYWAWEFNYSAATIIDEIAANGRVPNAKSHQFYPTPEQLARDAIALASVGATDDMIWLEPSAGQGGIADLMPSSPNTYCVEISALHCKILREKGHSAEQADFLEWQPAVTIDRIVMNPPFSEGRWQEHVNHAAAMLHQDGKLVAIVPASAKGKFSIEGFDIVWSEIYDNAFATASVSVVILCATRSQ